MKEYKKIQPEVIVGIGDNTLFLEKESPFRTITDLHIDLEDWLGDDLMECHPCYIVTEQLKKALEESTCTGFKFTNMRVTKAEYFDNNYHLTRPLPKFYWMNITGRENIDDIFICDRSSLFASDDFIHLLQKRFSVKYLEIDPEYNEFDALLDRMINERKKERNQIIVLHKLFSITSLQIKCEQESKNLRFLDSCYF